MPTEGTISEVEDILDAIMVDVSCRDVTHFDNIDEALGLSRSEDLTYEDICTNLTPIDVARNKKAAAAGFFGAITELGAKVNARAEVNSLENNYRKAEKRRSWKI